MRKNLISVFITMVFFISMFGFSQIPLCPSDCDKLTPEAKKHYKKAMEHIDRVYWKGALGELREAVKADPDHVNLHFLLARIARKRARIDTSLEESQKYYSIAENALLALEGRENLSRDQQSYLENSMEVVKKEKASLEQREKQRMEVGYKIIMDYMKQIGWFGEQKPEETEATAEGAEAATPSTSFSTPPGFSGAPGSSSPFGISPNLSAPSSGFPSSGPATSSPSPFDVTSSPAPNTSSPSPGSTPFDITGSATTEEPSAPSSTEPSNPFNAP